MLRKILFQSQDKKQLWIAMVGAFLGITFLMTSIHYLIKVNKYGEGADILGPNTLIVQKKVQSASSLALTKTDFSLNEVEKIKNEPFILDAQPVISNNFRVWFETADPMVPVFKTDVFIQTVDDDFLDVKNIKWSWKKEDKFVPIILPREFVVMLNTYMSATGIPPISDELAMDVKFKFIISNDSIKETVDARIVGFTNEISSILVPEEFMLYGNQKYGADEPQKITQVMISGKESEFGLVEQMINDKGLESKNAQMLVGRLKSVVGTLILVVLGISILAVFLSGLVLIQYLQLLLSKNAYEVKTLLRLGYHPRLITRTFLSYFVKIFGVISLIGFAFFVLLKFVLDEVFISGGLYIQTNFELWVLMAVLITFGLFTMASFRNAKRGVKKEW